MAAADERRVIIVTRPAEDAEPLMVALAAKGWAPLLAPTLTIAIRDDQTVDLTGVGGLLFTSANGVRALARCTASGRDLPTWAVGDATARAARAFGFQNVEAAGGDVYALAELVAVRYTDTAAPLLHVAGSDVAGDLAGALTARGLKATRKVLYEAVAVASLPTDAVNAFTGGRVAGVVFFSPRTARSFVSLAAVAGVTRHFEHVVAHCLSPAVAAAARTDVDGLPLVWLDVRSADAPNQAQLLASIPSAPKKLR